MLVSSKFDIKEKVYLVDIPWGAKATTENIRIIQGDVIRIILTSEGILYDVLGDMYYSDKKEKHLFTSKDNAEMWVFKKYFKGIK